jgi:hypothetical protein
MQISSAQPGTIDIIHILFFVIVKLSCLIIRKNLCIRTIIQKVKDDIL